MNRKRCSWVCRKRNIHSVVMTVTVSSATTLQIVSAWFGQRNRQIQRRIRPPSIGYRGSKLKQPWIKAHTDKSGKRRRTNRHRKLQKGPASVQSSSSFNEAAPVWMNTPPTRKVILKNGTRNRNNASRCPNSWIAAAR